MKEVRPILAFLTTAAPFLLTGSLNAQGILSPNDFVIGIDGNRNNPGLSNSGAEGPLSAFDGNNSTKWLSFGRTFTGLIVTPATAGTVVQSLSFTTGGDAPERDPVSYQLFGTNSTINSVSDGSGLAETWTLIGGGATGLGASTSPSLARNTTGTTVTVANTTPYNSYKVLFTALRKAGTGAFDPVTLANASNPNSIQLSEVRMFDGASNNIFATTPISAIGIDQTDSFSPPTERPIEAIDGIKTSASKYLNFGREGAGLIITPAMGSSTVRGIQITTANDTIARDPSAIRDLWHKFGNSQHRRF